MECHKKMSYPSNGLSKVSEQLSKHHMVRLGRTARNKEYKTSIFIVAAVKEKGIMDNLSWASLFCNKKKACAHNHTYLQLLLDSKPTHHEEPQAKA